MAIRASTQYSFAVAGAIAVFGISPAVFAADDAAGLLEVLEENVVSGASRTSERSSDAPAFSSVITGEQMRRLGIRKLEDALNFLSTGMFAHDRMSTAETGARGVTLTRDFNSHVLIVLDGMVMNEQGGGAVYLHDIPIEMIDRIEVILGPGSVLYGAQAMLGVINVVTRTPKDYEGFHGTTTFGVSPPLRSDGDFGKLSLSALGHDNRYQLGIGRPFTLFGVDGGLILSLDYSDFKGPRIEFAEQALPARPDGSYVADYGAHARPGIWGGFVHDQWYRSTTGGFARVDIGDFTWTTRATTTNAAMPQMDLFENRVGGAYDDARNHNAYVTVLSNLKYSKRLTPSLTGMGRVYFGYSRTAFSRYVIAHDPVLANTPLGSVDPEQCPPGPLGPCQKEAQFLSRWQGFEVQATKDWLGDGAYTTMLGVDSRLRTAAYEFVTTDVFSGQSYGSDPTFTRWHGGGNKKADEYAVGGYLQQVLRPWPILTANAGLRIDYDSRIAAKYLADALSPRIALIFAPTDQLTFKGIFSTAFRAPSFLELYIVNGRLLPNPEGLQPETVSSYELMGTLKQGAHTVTLGGFWANWKNLIELQIVKANAPSVSRYDNVDGIDNFGGNGSYEGAFFDRKLRIGMNLTLASTRRRLSDVQQSRNADFGVEDTVPLTVAPRVYGNARASWEFKHAVFAVAAGLFGPRIADQAFYGGDPSNLIPRPEANTQVEVRTALTGDIPNYETVGYLVGFNYAFDGHQPYVVGPTQGLPRYLSPRPVHAELALVNRFTAFIGLEFHLDKVSPTTEPSTSEPEPVAPLPTTTAPEATSKESSSSPSFETHDESPVLDGAAALPAPVETSPSQPNGEGSASGAAPNATETSTPTTGAEP